MNVYGKHYRTIWIKEDDPRVVQAIDQNVLPHQFKILDLTTVDQVAYAIAAHAGTRGRVDRRDGGLWRCISPR